MAKVSLLSKVEPLSYLSDEELRDLLNVTLSGISKRHETYNRYRSLVYDDSKRNFLYKYLRELVSLLYVSDNIIFDIALQEENKSEEINKVISELTKELYADFSDKGIDVQIYRWVFNALLYGSYFVKCIIDGSDISLKSVSPYDISVLYEDIPSIDEKEQVLVHIVRIPEHLAKKKYPYAIFKPAEVPYKDMSSFMDIISSSQGGNITVGIMPSGSKDSFIPKPTGKYVELYEMWIWDEKANDYAMVHFIGEHIKRYKNPFIPKMHPFVRLCINSIEEYFWGMSELHYIKDVQEKITYQEELLKYLQSMLLNPVMVVYGISGSIEAKEIQNKLSKPGEVVEIIDPTSKIDFYLPKLDPNFVQAIMKYYEEIFNQQTSVAGMLTGRGMPSVRSAKHAQLIAQFASAGLRDKALIVEYFIEKLMTLYATGLTVTKEKYALLNAVDYKVDVFAHTSSPIIAMSYQEMLFSLVELGLIKPDVLIDILPIPKKHEIKARSANEQKTS